MRIHRMAGRKHIRKLHLPVCKRTKILHTAEIRTTRTRKIHMKHKGLRNHPALRERTRRMQHTRRQQNHIPLPNRIITQINMIHTRTRPDPGKLRLLMPVRRHQRKLLRQHHIILLKRKQPVPMPHTLTLHQKRTITKIHISTHPIHLPTC